MTRDEARRLILETFEDIGLVFGGLVAVHCNPTDDDLVWRFMESLDLIRQKALKKIESKHAETRPNPMPHVAIEEFLRKGRTIVLYTPSAEKETCNADVSADVP